MFLDPSEVIKALSFPERPRIGDFGTGAGQYALMLAKRFGGNAKIYALDPLPTALSGILNEGSRYAPSFYTLHSDMNENIPLGTNLLTNAIVSNTLFQIKDRDRFVKELARVLEPDAQALVVDWAGSFNNMGPPSEAVLSPAEAVRLFKSAGFSTGEMLPAGTHHFAFVATNHTP